MSELETKVDAEGVIDSFRENNQKEGLRVFVAGGSRSGDDEEYVSEAYKLGRKIVKLGFRLDFGLSSLGIMGATAKGALDGWRSVKNKNYDSPINGVTTQEYYDFYTNDSILDQMEEIIIAKTLEERKQKLLEADVVVFAPGGVGTLDELSYDCVAMQDGLLPVKPFIIYNVNGYFHHLLEFLKEIAAKKFADPIPFIVVDDSHELDVALRLLKLKFEKADTLKEVYSNARQLIYELPYFIKKKEDHGIFVEYVIEDMENALITGNQEKNQDIANEVEKAYLEKEISKMYERLVKVSKDTATVSEKLTKLKKRKKANQSETLRE